MDALLLHLGDGFGIRAQTVSHRVRSRDRLWIGLFERNSFDKLLVGRLTLPFLEDEIPTPFAMVPCDREILKTRKLPLS